MITTKTIDGLLLREMVIAGAALLERNRENVDALNVFPVPDGDTGTNMSLTMASAVREVNQKELTSASAAADALAKGALRGARGNSGVITSQIYRGFAKALSGIDEITPVQFAAAMKRGADTAYKAVMKPKEGTILTVARVMAEDAVRQAESEPDDYDALFRTILQSGEAILKRTPEMLPVLKQAGVVDAGGRGLLLIFTGYAAALRGENILEIVANEAEAPEESEIAEIAQQQFAYGLDFEVESVGDFFDEGAVTVFKRQLNRIGDRLQLEQDGAVISVHLNTDDPAKALSAALEIGEINRVQVENYAKKRRLKQQEEEKARQEAEKKKYGMVSVCLGSGFSEIFKDLQVDAIVDGGQTMNPSIEDLENAINSINAETVFIFPNNGNVVLAAQQAAEIAEREAYVINTKNVAMGIAAAVAFNPDIDAQKNVEAMEEAAQTVRTGTITYAVRDSDFEELHISQGDIIGLENGRVSCKSDNIHDIAMQLTQAIVQEDDGLITLYYGEDIKEDDAQALADEIAQLYPDCDVEIHYGGQPLYYYIIAVE